MKVLFLSIESSHIHNAYHHRLRMLAAGLNNIGIQTDFVYFRDRFPPRPILLQPFSCFNVPKIIYDCDIIHGGDTAGTYAGFILKFRLSKPIVYDIHGDALQDDLLFLSEQPWNPRRMFHVMQAMVSEIVANRVADGYIVVSEFQRERLLSKGIPPKKIELIRNGVDTSHFRPSIQSSTNDFTFCYVGTMREYQDIEVLSKAFHGLNLRNVKLKMVGFSQKDTRLKVRILSLLKERVELLDLMPQEQLINHLFRADVLVLPRKRHKCMKYGFPIKFAEYAAMGKPVLVSDIDETALLVHKNDCGFVYQASNSESLTATLREAAGTKRERFLQMGENSRRLANKEFEWQRISEKYAVFLEKIVQDSTRKESPW